MNDRSCFVAAVLLLPALAGCSEIIYTETDEGSTREIRQGSSFGVSLPAGVASADRAPKIEGALVRYLGHHAEEGKGREIYEFRAEGAGEAVVRIPSDVSLPQAYVIRLIISPAAATRQDWSPQSPAQGRPY